MASKKRKLKSNQLDEASQNFADGYGLTRAHPILAPLMHRAGIHRHADLNSCPREGWAVVTNLGRIYVHPTRLADDQEWAYILAHCILHLAFDHYQEREDPIAWNAACDVYVARFLKEMHFGTPPAEMQNIPIEDLPRQEIDIYQRFLESGIPPQIKLLSTAGEDMPDMWVQEEVKSPFTTRVPTWPELFGQGLNNAVQKAVDYAGGEISSIESVVSYKTPGQRARSWFISSFPLLGALAASFTIIEDRLLCYRMQISVAAVDAELREIYLNPASGLHDDEIRFVMAHELLHVALRHHARRQGRDPYLWNIACDYVINQWLVDMNIGAMPTVGLLYDPALKGLNAEAIYDQIVGDMRRFRKLATLRGIGLGDMLEPSHKDWWTLGEGLTLDEFYRRALAQGLYYHEYQGRGFLPAGLIEEIMAQSQPPIPWDVELARWFDAHFPPIDSIRTYARPSRRQSSTPDIPRPRYVPDPRVDQSRTYGVILDTSGSMDRNLLARALGAIASYSITHDVTAVRVVFCDAHPYDQGYMSPEDIAGRVRVKGRGGTVLMPAVRLLQNAEDFPKDGPLLIITDTYCDRLAVQREHAYLIPEGKHLPFAARGPVFYISP